MSNTNNKATLPWYFRALVVLYAFHSTLPILGFNTPAVVHAANMALLYGFLFIKEGRTALSDFAKIIPIFAIHILSILYKGFGNIAVELYWLLQLMVYPLLSLYLIRIGDQRSAKRLVVILGLSFIVTSITTYFGCRAYPGASRDLAAMLSTRDPALYALYMSLNIGSFSFIYALVLLLPLLVFAIKEKLVYRWIGLAVLAIVVMAIIVSDYTTALLCMTVSIIILFVSPRRLKTIHFVLMAVLIFVLILASDWLIVPFLDKLGGIVGREIVSDRLQELSALSSNESSFLEGDMEARSDLYMKSINSFLDSPVWGSSSAKLGGHSYVLDNMGQFGLLGLIGMIIVFRAIFKRFFAPFKQQKFYGHILFSFLVAILLALLNPKDYLTVLTFYIPLFCVAFSDTTEYEDTLDCQ